VLPHDQDKLCLEFIKKNKEKVAFRIFIFAIIKVTQLFKKNKFLFKQTFIFKWL